MNNNKVNYLLTKVEEHLEQAEYRLDQAMMQSAADFDASLEPDHVMLPLTALMRSDLLRVNNFLLSLRAELDRTPEETFTELHLQGLGGPEPEPEPEPKPDNGGRSRSAHVTKEQAFDVECPKCGANQRKPCHKVITNKWNTKVTRSVAPPHRERKDAYRRKHGLFILGE